MISQFKGEHWFLSNFYPAQIRYKRRTFKTAEHAFQWAKTTDRDRANMIMLSNKPSDAKRLGRIAPLRADWEKIKIDVMKEILASKFSHPALAARLRDTGEHALVEGNNWGDTFWGAIWTRHGGTPQGGVWFSKGPDGLRLVGHNHLGVILMEIRDNLEEHDG